MNLDHSASDAVGPPHQGKSSGTKRRVGRSALGRLRNVFSRSPKPNSREAATALTTGPNDRQIMTVAGTQATQMFQEAHDFAIQAGSTFLDVQGHVVASCTSLPTLSSIDESSAARQSKPSPLNSDGVASAVPAVSVAAVQSFQGASNLAFNAPADFINAQSYTKNIFVAPSILPQDVAVVAEALSTINFRNFLADHLRKRVGKTGRWVFSEAKFRKWRKAPRGILWGTGMPGAGKTILASIIVEYLMELAKGNKRICVAFAFSRYTDALTVEEILAGLLRQILEDHPQTIVYIQRMHDHHSLRKTRPSKRDLVGVLEAIFTSNLFDEKYCSLDGLDEAKSITQFELLDTLSQLPVNLLITSRPLHLLEGKFLTADHFSIIVQDSDIERLIEEKVRQIPTLEALLANDGFKRWVVKAIIEKSSGMFLVASLQLDMLAVCVNVHGLRKAVATLPTGVEAMYEITMVRVEAHSQAATAKRALTWLVHALKSLEMDDLRSAIAVDPETFKFDSELLIDGPTLLSLCCGLVTFDSESELVRLVHYTAKDFLEPYLKREDPDPHAMLASTCVARLVQFNLDNLPAAIQADRAKQHQYLDDILDEHPFFLPYSARQWAEHLHLSVALPASTRDFILHCSSHPIRNKYGSLACAGSSIHVAAAYNFHELLEEWFHPSCHPADGSQSQFPPTSPPDLDINAPASDGSTALILAACFSHAETVRVLLNVEGIDVASGDRYGYTALMYAAETGGLEIVEMLLAVVDTNHTSRTDVDGNTALTLASSNGRVEAVRALLRVRSTKIKNLSQGDSSEEVGFIRACSLALVGAAENGHQDVMEILLDVKGINVNYPVSRGHTALMHASATGRKSIVEMLLQHENIDVHYTGPNGRTALAYALKKSKHDIAELLRSHGAQEPSADVFREFIHNDSIVWWWWGSD
ncbi:hypothetical protein FA15DRAFT_644639 [Coprinopsis marcescibilis]|uniref:Uncharacterized protein n=1 Tax=Coprinopsis marcescibilis TaxID=230819 RepID=A0A5C3L1J9_COPMA|nr:hypothetical protein FA15DRAFT_644639 [Coprinopsis marcescibilis]